jgi:hypothetical protein
MENRKTVGNVVSALRGVDMWRVVLEESDCRYMQKHILSETSFESYGYESEDNNIQFLIHAPNQTIPIIVLDRLLPQYWIQCCQVNQEKRDIQVHTGALQLAQYKWSLNNWKGGLIVTQHFMVGSQHTTFKNNHAMMLVISEHQTGMEAHRDIDVQDLSDQESMMSLTLETKVETKEMDTVTTKLEDIDLKSVDEYLDLCLMENTGSDIKI